MFKNKIFIVIVVVAVALAGIGCWYAYDRHQAALAAEKAEQEALAKAEAEKKAAEEEAARKAAEEADKEAANDSALEEYFASAKEIDETELTEEDKAAIETLSKKYGPEMDAIREMLTAYNRAQNEYDYRTYTGHEGEEYMCPETAANFAKVNAPANKERVVREKEVSKFDGITVKYCVFTTPDFGEVAENPENPAYAYAEVEVRAHDIEPVKEEVSSSYWAVWLKKIDGQWKIYVEEPIEDE
jgi:ketosteroid isomerase-like protein